MANSSQSVSIVIPTYQRGQILLETLRHLLALPDNPIEIMVVDQTEKHPPGMLRAFEVLENDGLIRWIKLDKPSIPHAMNVGLREANSDVVLFLDDDIIPDSNLICSHLDAYTRCPDAWAVVGQVLQPEDGFQRSEDGSQRSDDRCRRTEVSGLRKDLGFRFNGTESAWVENVMAGNLSVKRDQALALGGFDENFIPPVSFRFETEFAKRLVAAGGRIRFEPTASIQHLRASAGGTRSRGSHLTSASPVHGVGDYYYALLCAKGLERIGYILSRLLREVRTKYHLTHPSYIPVKLLGEFRAMVLAFRLYTSTDCIAVRNRGASNAKSFYDAKYSEGSYAAYASSDGHSFRLELKALISRYCQAEGRWLEVGCGRGYLQDIVDDYTGVDLAETAATYLHKPFHCAPAEQLPFPDSEFDGIWSYAVLEHVIDPEKAMLEMRRVLRPGGILILAPAWQCRPWASRDYAWKPYLELCLKYRFLKALIPLRNSVVFRSAFIMPRRLLRLLVYGILRRPMRFRYRSLTPCYEVYHVADADARHSMDPFEAILWFRSRGDRVLSHPNLINAILIRTGVIVVEVKKRIANEKMEECQ